MNTIAIIAEFNPFHNGHLHLIDRCRKELDADCCVVVMSGDFVQRGAPSIVDKFTRTKMALSCGVDLCLELPIYYSIGSAEYFASGAVSILDGLKCIDYLCFGSECGDISILSKIADVLANEPQCFKDALSEQLKAGNSFALARQKALFATFEAEGSSIPADELDAVLSSPNNILGIEYIKALIRQKSSIRPYTIARSGEGYKSPTVNALASASGIRQHLLSGLRDIAVAMPEEALKELVDYNGSYADTSLLSDLLYYRLVQEKSCGYHRFLDVSDDLSNKIKAGLESYQGFDELCESLKSKDLTYSRISRSLLHILLDIRQDHMDEYCQNGYAAYARILGMRETAFPFLKRASEASSISVINGLKTADKLLDDKQKRLLTETLNSSLIYNRLIGRKTQSEYRMKPVIF